MKIEKKNLGSEFIFMCHNYCHNICWVYLFMLSLFIYAEFIYYVTIFYEFIFLSFSEFFWVYFSEFFWVFLSLFFWVCSKQFVENKNQSFPVFPSSHLLTLPSYIITLPSSYTHLLIFFFVRAILYMIIIYIYDYNDLYDYIRFYILDFFFHPFLHPSFFFVQSFF